MGAFLFPHGNKEEAHYLEFASSFFSCAVKHIRKNQMLRSSEEKNVGVKPT
jgi:hypothetical protein